MKKIYYLSIGDNIFYIGQTKLFLIDRLTMHLNSHPELKGLPIWIKKCVSITSIEECTKELANNRERYWIRHYKLAGHELINRNIFNQKPLKPKHAYVRLSLDQVREIYKNNYCRIAYLLGLNSETIRLCLQKRRIKKAYFEEIFQRIIPELQSVANTMQQ